MTLIFDSFPNHATATAFAVAVRTLEPELEVTICETVDESDDVNLFPYLLTPPIVHVERPYSDDDDAILRVRELGGSDEPATGAEREAALESAVLAFSGEYRGT